MQLSSIAISAYDCGPISIEYELEAICNDLRVLSLTLYKIQGTAAFALASHGSIPEDKVINLLRPDLRGKRHEIRTNARHYLVRIPILASSKDDEYTAILYLRRGIFQPRRILTKQHVVTLRHICDIVAAQSMLREQQLTNTAIRGLLDGYLTSNPFEHTLNVLVELFQCTAGSIWEYHSAVLGESLAPAYLTLEATASHPMSEYTQRCVSDGDGVLWNPLRPKSPKLMYGEKLKKSELVNPHLFGLFQERFLMLRLEAAGTVYGVVCLNGVNNIQPSNLLPTLETFERLAALEILNKKISNNSRILQQLTQELAPTNNNIKQVCDVAVIQLCKLLCCQAVSIFLKNTAPGATDRLTLVAVHHEPSLQPSIATKSFKEGNDISYPIKRTSLTAKVFLSGKPLLSNNVSIHSVNSHLYREIADTTNDTWVGVPLFNSVGLCIGVIRSTGKQTLLGGNVSNYIFDGDDVRVLQHCANMLAPVIETLQTVSALENVNTNLAASERLREHEVKGPLAAIGANAEFVRKYFADKGVTSKDRRLNDIISDSTMCAFLLRDPGLPTRETFERQKQIVSLTAIIAELKSFLQRQINARSEAVEKEQFEEAEPELTITPFMRVDYKGRIPKTAGNRHLLQRALYNIAINAVKYGLPGGYLKMTLEENIASGWQTIEFEDDGIGIGEDDLPHIFENRYRGVIVREKYPGEGLGLTLAKQILLLHGGDIAVINPRGPTLFRVTLPIVAQEDLPTAEEDPAIVRWDIPVPKKSVQL